MADLHLETRGGSNAICGEKDPTARIANDPEIVTCIACRALPQFATRVRHHEDSRARGRARAAARG